MGEWQWAIISEIQGKALESILTDDLLEESDYIADVAET